MHTQSKRKSGQEAIVHADLTKKSLELFLAYCPDSVINDFQEDIVRGSIEEDNKPFYTNCAKHFCSIDRRGLKTFLGQTDAFTYSSELFRQAVNFSNTGQMQLAHYTLGRTLHLAQDNWVVPAHAGLIDHLLKQLKTKTSQLFDENYLQNLKNLGLEFPEGEMIVLDQGDPFEIWAARHSLDNLLKFNPPTKIVSASSLEELFFDGIREIAQPRDKHLARVLEKNYIPQPGKNGLYASEKTSRQISNDDAGTIAYFLVPRAIERGAALFELFEKNKKTKSVNTNELEGLIYHMGCYITANKEKNTINCPLTEYFENPVDALEKAYALAENIRFDRLPIVVLVLDKKIVHTEPSQGPSGKISKILIDASRKKKQDDFCLSLLNSRISVMMDIRNCSVYGPRGDHFSEYRLGLLTLYEKGDQMRYRFDSVLTYEAGSKGPEFSVDLPVIK